VIIGDLVSTDRMLCDGYIAVRGEIIAAICQGAPPTTTDTLDHGGGLIPPGLVDRHIHTGSAIGWPSIEGATRSAAAGGVTTCVDRPHDVPHPVTDAGKLADKIGWVERTAYVGMARYGTILKCGDLGAIAEFAADGLSAFKLSTYEYDAVRFPRIDHPTMVETVTAIARIVRPDAVHNEDHEPVERLIADARTAGRTEAIMYRRTRPSLGETMADRQIFEIGLQTSAARRRFLIPDEFPGQTVRPLSPMPLRWGRGHRRV